MFFVPPGCTPETVENYLKMLKTKENNLEEEKDKQKMQELKREMKRFLNLKNTISTSGMMYYSHLYLEYSKLAKKYNDWELL
jgi:hypothetical protein